MIRFDQHGMFEVTDASLLRHIGGADPLPTVPNVACPSGGGSNLGCPVYYNFACGPIVIGEIPGLPVQRDEPPYDNIVCTQPNC
jgi:hypothetical protein